MDLYVHVHPVIDQITSWAPHLDYSTATNGPGFDGVASPSIFGRGR